MIYKVFLSNGHNSYTFYEKYEDKADLIYKMARFSKLFDYASLSECRINERLIDEWSDTE